MAGVLLITPPFTQLNTPYPATAYLKGFLNSKNIPSAQADLGIETILRFFSKTGLTRFFDSLHDLDVTLDDGLYRIHNLRASYVHTIDAVIRFLQHKDPTLAHLICGRSFLPEGNRFANTNDLEWAFGAMGVEDKARHLATLYLEDLGDLIKATADEHFGFSRYAERLGRTASGFDLLLQELQKPETIFTSLLGELLEEKMQQHQPGLVALSVPFPGNLFGALKCAQILKRSYPGVKVALGGGFANTELRRISDPRVFDLIDFICLDDGEMPLLALYEHTCGQRTLNQLKRTFARENSEVKYYDGASETDVPQKDCGTPDYDGLPLRDYLSVIEVTNPMHRLWSDGRWNKLTLAHGCYWGRCSFCDISLDYVKRYEPLTAALICDRMEELISKTGNTGFHFVDEAAPPNLLRELSLEIIRRKLVVSWWTNIRFEKLFTPDLARLMKAAGCIAVAGGLEVASDRLLEMMKKGVTVAQVARVADGFTRAGIMVHAYLMYGFPTQTEKETINSLEMVRQLFECGVLQSGFWHRFAMTAHSPVGLKPQTFEVQHYGPQFEGFAENDFYHHDPKGANHDKFSDGLRISLYNYMHGAGLELPLKKWFEHKVPATDVPKNFIRKCLEDQQWPVKQQAVVVWPGILPEYEEFEVEQRNNKMKLCEFQFHNKQKDWILQTDSVTGSWLNTIFPKLIIAAGKSPLLLKELKQDFEIATGLNFDQFQKGEVWQLLLQNGLLIL